MTPHALAIDLGTSGPKVALVGLDGRLAAARAGSVAMDVDGDRAEQDPEEIWRSIVTATQAVIAEADLPTNSIVSVSCASQYFSLLPIGRDGEPLAPLVTWMDKRGARYNHALYERHPEAFTTWADVHGMVPLPSGADSLAHLLFFFHECPEVYERAAWFVEPMDYVTARLCGTWAANPCSAFAQMFTDNRDPTQPRYDERLVAMAGIDRAKLPPLAEVNARLGTLRPAVAAELGLAPTTPVFAGVNDTQAASIGTATFRAGVGALNVGTTGQVLAHVPGKRSDFDNEIVSMPSPLRGRHLAMAENGLGARPLDFFLRSIACSADALGDHRVADPFAGIEDVLRDVPPGSHGVLFLPWLAGSGAPSGSTSARGGFLNLSLQSTRADMTRAVLEGCALSLRWLLPAVEAFAEDCFATLRFSGGAAVSPGWAQVMADVVQRPIEPLADGRCVNDRALATLAFDEPGLCDHGAVDRLCPVRARVEPVAAHAEVYDVQFEALVTAFEQLRPLHALLNPHS